ncbi:DUF58 domain-containing protein [Brachybacterium alimentarium]|uniref:DUF58 domain-containing protein n=1 Tax=Brachybacterium alimentarium TaxID=47845 RepID=UPI000DF2DAB2|nr:DUF58 domain-containing protein [Brachybacterium alimentarium]RCS68312.1 DUF58 domain-containing protein [Brachybacterium alimentarium]
MTPRPGTVLRPTARGVVVAVLAVLCWVLSELTRLLPARYLAAALLLALLVGGIGIVLGSIGLRARRQVIDDAAPVGAVARVQLELVGNPPLTVLPLARGAVREHLPGALGGQGDLPLGRRMPHVLPVRHRGTHELGPYSLLVRDLFGLFHLRRTSEDALRITGLPVLTEMAPAAERAAGITRDGPLGAMAVSGVGEIGPIARPYAAGDDIRRIQWRASARTGQLMTREDEPAAGLSAVIVLDTTRRGETDPAVEDRLVSHAATVLDSLGINGWDVRIVDASGDEITRSGRRRGIPGPSLLGSEADAVEQRASLMALAGVVFDDDEAARVRVGIDHAAGQTALAIAFGVDHGDPFEGLQLDRFAGRATHRTAIALRPAYEEADGEHPRRARRIGPADGDDFGRAHEEHAAQLAAAREDAPPVRSRLGGWTLVRGTTADSLDDLLTAADAEETA